MVEWQRRESEVLIALYGLTIDQTRHKDCTPKLDKSISETY